MKQGRNSTLAIVALLWSGVLYAVEKPDLKYIHFTPEFESNLGGEVLSGRMGAKSVSPGADWRAKLVPLLFDAEVAQASAERRTGSMKAMRGPGEGQDSLLYTEIQNWLGTQYQGIGAQQAAQVTQFNSMFNLGTQNFSGFTWQKPFGGFNLYVERQLSPDLFDANRWIVMDNFTFEIEASTFLGKLQEGGVISLTNSELAAFAGIKFKRVYTTYSYAASFTDGLVTDYSTLFLPFLAYTPSRVLAMKPGGIMKRLDQWTLGAGGIVESPTFYGMSFSGGALAQLTNQSVITFQGMMKNDQLLKPTEFLRVSHVSAQTKSGGMTMGMQMDFFKLIQFTLLSYDLSFEQEKSKEFTLSFAEADKEHLLEDDGLSHEFAGLLKRNSPDIHLLEPYVVSLQESDASSSSSRAMLLLWGNLKKASLESVRVIKDRVVKEFFRSHSESIKIVQDFWSRLFSSFIFRIFKFHSFVANEASFSRNVDIEYEATLPQSADPNKMTVEFSEQFSMNLALSYQAQRTDRWSDKVYKNDIQQFLERYTTLPANLRTMLRNEDLIGPVYAVANLKVMGDGLAYFNALPETQVKAIFSDVCGGRESCVKSMLTPYTQYKKVLASTQKLELYQFKSFMTIFARKAKGLMPYYGLFGEYAFFHGSFSAYSKAGLPFSTTFTSGQFRGLGVIDTYQRLNGTRTPATVGGE